MKKMEERQLMQFSLYALMGLSVFSLSAYAVMTHQSQVGRTAIQCVDGPAVSSAADQNTWYVSCGGFLN